MRHLSETELALASRGDLPVWAQFRAQSHSLICPDCRRRLDLYRQDRARVRAAVDAFELPRAMKLDEIENEMYANIRLGLEVSAIRQDFGRREETDSSPISWRAMAAVGALSVIVTTGWFLAGPDTKQYMRPMPAAVAHVRSGAVLLRGDESGIGVENRGVGLFFRNVSSPSARFEVGLEGSLRTSTIDKDSDQVTVSQIYVE